MSYRLDFYQDRGRKWRWRLWAENGKKVACSGEGYSRKIDCRTIAKKLFPWLSVSEGA